MSEDLSSQEKKAETVLRTSCAVNKVSKINPKKRAVTRTHALWYHFCQGLSYLLLKLFFRVKYINSKNVPKTGPVLLVSNHQSFIDPPAIGCGYFRMTNFLARKTLFKFKPFGKLIDSVDAIPLETEGLGFQGIKETLRRLKNNEAVLIFPEGSRTCDGELAEFTSGYASLAVKANAVIVPAAIAGAFEAFPRTKKLPSPFKPRVIVEYGVPITPDAYQGKSDDEICRLVESQIKEIYERIRRRPKTKK
ncbi:MAG: lysophospholipid acyltransferase family protein [Thermoguttaceae bacterium]|nr:lysophospholipid acyltransferase family protein [Thermoguttaceae bacterium]